MNHLNNIKSYIQKIKLYSKTLIADFFLWYKKYTKCIDKKINKIIVINLCIVIVLIIAIVIIVYSVSPISDKQKLNDTEQQAMVMQQKSIAIDATQRLVILNKIESQLQKLQSHSDQAKKINQNHQALEDLAMQLGTLIQTERHATEGDRDKVKTIQQTQAKIAQQNTAMKAQLEAIHKAVSPTRYLSEKVLPFNVEGLSFWNGQPMVTISMMGINGQRFYKLIGKGEAYACGDSERSHDCSYWFVKRIDVNAGNVILKNHQNQLVKVSL